MKLLLQNTRNPKQLRQQPRQYKPSLSGTSLGPVSGPQVRRSILLSRSEASLPAAIRTFSMNFSAPPARVSKTKKNAREYVWMYNNIQNGVKLREELMKSFPKGDVNWWYQIPPQYKRTQKMSNYRGTGRFEVAQGFFITRHSAPIRGETQVAFACQIMPQPVKLQGTTVTHFAKDLSLILNEQLAKTRDEKDRPLTFYPWRFHMVASSSTPIFPSSAGRGSLYYELMEQLRKKKPASSLAAHMTTAFKTFLKRGGQGKAAAEKKIEVQKSLTDADLLQRELSGDDWIPKPFQSDEALVQVIFSSLRKKGQMHAFVSVCLPEDRQALTNIISPFPAGAFPIKKLKSAPSEASDKLMEAFSILGKCPSRDELVLDLGCTPGGWSYVCLKLGSQVIGIDKAKPTDEISKAEKFRFFQKDIFSLDSTFLKQEKLEPTWILCDVVTVPEKTSSILKSLILPVESCQNFVVTFKYKKFDDIQISSIKEEFSQLQEEWSINIKKLLHSGHEITVLGQRRQQIPKE